MNDELTPESTPSDGPALHSAAMHDPGPDTEVLLQQVPSTAGGMIRNARRSQGIALASLAAMLKIPVRRLEALENGRHGELQGPTFERALAQAACRALRIDPKPVLALLPQHENNTLESVTDGINTPFRDGRGGFDLPQLPLPWVFAVVVLIAAALALWLVPEGWFAHATRPLMDSLSSAAPASAPAAAAAPASASEADQVAAAARELAASDVEAGASAPSVAAPDAPVPAAAASVAQQPAAAAPAVQAASDAAAAPGGLVQVIADEDSWVEVVDAKGHTLLSRTVAAGESVDLDGAMPMHVKIGNVAGTQLKVRGQIVDLTRWDRDNVARFQVK